MEKIECLKQVSFGERIAEDESQKLKHYFVSTDIWNRLYDGKFDVIYGPKGSGKSALYSILEAEMNDLFDKNILVTSAENPRGNTVFNGLTTNPPTSETEFVRLWKLYFLVITNSILSDWNIENDDTQIINKALADSGLIPPVKNLRSFLQTCLSYVQNMSKVESLQPGVNLSEATGLPTGLNFKISFREPNTVEQIAGVVSTDSLYEHLHSTLADSDLSLWILIDRLDVAFSENLKLETNALKALFIVYNDLKPFETIKLKIFLRDDIWRRITKDGFREASHITKTVTITWTKESLLNLIISRALNNDILIEYFDLKKDEILASYNRQEETFYKLFPDQIDQGEKKPKTLDWLLTRVKDGLDIVAPREIIHLLNESILEQIKLFERGEDKTVGECIVSSNALKSALHIVSKVRLEQTIYAEYPSLRPYMEKLTDAKAEQNSNSLAAIWQIDGQDATEKAAELAEIGFFEVKGHSASPVYKVPFLYRNALGIIQGSADL